MHVFNQSNEQAYFPETERHVIIFTPKMKYPSSTYSKFICASSLTDRKPVTLLSVVSSAEKNSPNGDIYPDLNLVSEKIFSTTPTLVLHEIQKVLHSIGTKIFNAGCYITKLTFSFSPHSATLNVYIASIERISSYLSLCDTSPALENSLQGRSLDGRVSDIHAEVSGSMLGTSNYFFLVC